MSYLEAGVLTRRASDRSRYRLYSTLSLANRVGQNVSCIERRLTLTGGVRKVRSLFRMSSSSPELWNKPWVNRPITELSCLSVLRNAPIRRTQKVGRKMYEFTDVQASPSLRTVCSSVDMTASNTLNLRWTSFNAPKRLSGSHRVWGPGQHASQASHRGTSRCEARYSSVSRHGGIRCAC